MSIFNGTEGNDTIQGSAGADTLRGGAGNDIYIVNNSADVIEEYFNIEGASSNTGIEKISIPNSIGNFVPNGRSNDASFSADGSKVVFTSNASNLVAADTNTQEDVFLKDLQTGLLTRVSVGANGSQANGYSNGGELSSDGTKILFESRASNLVANDTNNTADLFIKDLITGQVSRVNTSAIGEQATGEKTGNIFAATFSADGNKVVFASAATNLVAGDTNKVTDVFVKDLITGVINRVNITGNGTQANGNTLTDDIHFSADGTKVIFTSAANNLVAGDTNKFNDIFIKDLVSGVISRVSVSSTGAQGDYGSSNASFSSDGTKIVFESDASNFFSGDINDGPDIFIKDLLSGAVTLVSSNSLGKPLDINNGFHRDAVFSPDGTKVAFSSSAGDQLANGVGRSSANVFLKDIVTGYVTLMSSNKDGLNLSNYGNSNEASFSADGKHILFASNAADLVDGEHFNSINRPPYTIFSKEIIVETQIVDFGGVDTAQASIDYTLPSYVENLTLTGTAIKGTGNELNNIITGNNSDNILNGATGNDTLNGDSGRDQLNGGSGNDYLIGGSGQDVLTGSSGFDNLYGGSNKDTLYGGSDNDFMMGDSGNDILYGGSGNDALYAGSDNDILYGGSSNDVLNGGSGNDKLYAESGDDVLTGGDGNDTFIYALLKASDATGGQGRDIIFDFQSGGNTIYTDKIDINELLINYAGDDSSSALAPYIHIVQSGNNSILQIDRDGSGSTYSFANLVVLQNVHTNLDQLLAQQQLII